MLGLASASGAMGIWAWARVARMIEARVGRRGFILESGGLGLWAGVWCLGLVLGFGAWVLLFLTTEYTDYTEAGVVFFWEPRIGRILRISFCGG